MRKYYIGLLLLVFVLLTGCSNEESGEQDQSDVPEKEEQEAENLKKEEPEEDTNELVFPLTGETANGEIDHRAIAVMVNNHPKARPQTGLSQADIVYELLAEGEITRLLAVFHSDMPEEVGPVRSARPYYFDLAKANDAIYTYHGAANFINDQIKNDGSDYLNGAFYDNDGKLFRRDNSRKAPHNSYLLTSGIESVAKQKGYDSSRQINPLSFTADKAASNKEGEETSELKIVYSKRFNVTVSYAYDEQEERYIRYNDGQKTVEKDDNTPIALDNVLIIETSHEVVDSAGRRNIDLNAGGKGYLLQKGKLHEVTWKNEDGRIVPYLDGEKAGYVPGQTWVNVIPSNPGLEQSVSYR